MWSYCHRPRGERSCPHPTFWAPARLPRTPTRHACRSALIAERPYVSDKTVANYVSAVMRELGAEDRSNAIAIIRSRRRG